jgi:hypothetical protein
MSAEHSEGVIQTDGMSAGVKIGHKTPLERCVVAA